MAENLTNLLIIRSITRRRKYRIHMLIKLNTIGKMVKSTPNVSIKRLDRTQTVSNLGAFI